MSDLDVNRICYRSNCARAGAICQHRQSGQWYCVPCARKINQYYHDGQLITIPPMETRKVLFRKAAPND